MKKYHVLILFLLLTVAASAQRGSIRPGYGLKSVRDSMLTLLLDAAIVKTMGDSLGFGADTTARLTDAIAGFLDSARATSWGKQIMRYTLKYSLTNTVQLDGYFIYPNNGNDSTLAQFPQGYATTIGGSVTPHRVQIKSSYVGTYTSSVSMIDVPPIGSDSAYLTIRLKTTGTGATPTREIVIVKHAVQSAAITPAITAGTEVWREGLPTGAFGSTGSGAVTLKFSLWFNRLRATP